MTAPVKIRPATDSELERIAQIWDESWHSTGVPSPEVLSISQLTDRLLGFTASGADIYAVEHNQFIAGMMVLDAASHTLSQLFLAPAFQGLGLGAACLTFAKTALPGGFTLTVADANDKAQDFYIANGLTREARFFREEYARFDLLFRWVPDSPQKNPAP